MKWKPIDIIVLILSLIVVISLGTTALSSAIKHIPIPEDRMDLVITIYASTIAIISMYVGNKLKNKKDDD